MGKVILWIVLTIVLFIFFSYKLLEVPTGINGDEAAFGYNATLLARTLRDQNGRKLPVFILAQNRTTWIQPVDQYFMAAVFKIFGPSLFNLRMTSVITAVISVLIIFVLGKELMGAAGGILSAVILATTPTIMIQSHLAFDNITPIPFIIIWLLFLAKYSRTKKVFYLALSGFALGVSFYTFKSMRIFVPMWTLLTLIYLFLESYKTSSKKVFLKIPKAESVFVLSILPFFVVIPWLEFQYAGAIFNNQTVVINNIYKFIYSYIANFDLSFLFIKGDELLFHTTGTHGMLLLATLPIFILGLIISWNKNYFWKLIIASFFLGPLLFGYIGQIHRANRLLPLIPIYSLIVAMGFIKLRQMNNKLIFAVASFLIIFNYLDFLRYYWGDYSLDTKNLYDCYSCKLEAYGYLKNESIKRNLSPSIDLVLANKLDSTSDFIRAMHFDKTLSVWDGNTKFLNESSILMTDNSDAERLVKINQIGSYYFYVTK